MWERFINSWKIKPVWNNNASQYVGIQISKPRKYKSRIRLYLKEMRKDVPLQKSSRSLLGVLWTFTGFCKWEKLRNSLQHFEMHFVSVKFWADQVLGSQPTSQPANWRNTGRETSYVLAHHILSQSLMRKWHDKLTRLKNQSKCKFIGLKSSFDSSEINYENSGNILIKFVNFDIRRLENQSKCKFTVKF